MTKMDNKRYLAYLALLPLGLVIAVLLGLMIAVCMLLPVIVIVEAIYRLGDWGRARAARP